MASVSRLKYTATALTADGLVVRESSTKAGALRLAATLPGSVRVATPTGNLVKYVHNLKEAERLSRPGRPAATKFP